MDNSVVYIATYCRMHGLLSISYIQHAMDYSSEEFMLSHTADFWTMAVVSLHCDTLRSYGLLMSSCCRLQFWSMLIVTCSRLHGLLYIACVQHVVDCSSDETLSMVVSEALCFLRVMQPAAFPTPAPTSCVHIMSKADMALAVYMNR
jgi:hypothetical protein